MTEEHTRRGAVTPSVQAVIEFLRYAQTSYRLVDHEPVMSAAAEARTTHVPPDQVAKTIVLDDGANRVIAAIPASQRLDLHKLRRLLNATRRLRLAREDRIARDFAELEVGAIPPFGPRLPDTEVIDRRLLEHDRILCAAGDHRHGVIVDPRDVVRMTAARTADICQD